MSDLKFGVVFDVNNGRFKSEVKENTQLIQKLGGANQVAAGKSRQFGAELDTTEKKLFRTNKVATAVRNSIAGLAAGFGAFQLGTGLVRELAAFQDIRTRLMGLSESAADYANKEQWLIDLAKEHHKELNGLADGYSRLSTLTQEKVINDGQARDMLEGLSNAAAQNGATNADLERVYYGLAQALGQGVVQMQEVNQVVEPLPGLMSKLARAAGQETSAGFKTLIASGEVTSEMFGGLLVTALKEYEGAAVATGDNINAKYRDIKLEYQLIAKELEQPIEGALLPTLNGLVEGLAYLRTHTEGVIDVLQVGLVVALGHSVNALSNKAAATTKNIIASRASAVAAKNQATAEHQLAIAYKASAVGSVQNTIADQRLAAARTTLTAATNKANIAMKLGGGAMALLGGPAGVAILGAYALYELAGAMDETKSGSDQLSESLGKTTKSITEMTRAEHLSTQASYRKLITEKKAAIDELEALAKKQKENSNTSGSLYDGAEIASIVSSGQADEARAELEALKNALSDVEGALFDAGMEKIKWNDVVVNGVDVSSPKKPPEQDKKSLDVFADQEQALTRQLALLGQTTQLAKAEYETTLGKYKDLLPGQKAALINLAQEIDAKNKSLDTDKEAISQASQLKSASDSYAQSLLRKATITSESSNVAQLQYEIEHGSLKGINDELRTNLELLAQKADATALLGEQQLPFWEQMREHISATSQDFDTMWGNTFTSFAQNMGDAVSTSIMEGQNFGDTMKTIARSAVKEVISGLVQIGIKRLALFAIEKTIGTTGAAANIATAAATGTAMATSYAPAAAFASLASFGANSVPAATGIAATFALTEGLALAGMAHDGIDNVPKEGTWLLDKGERVVDNRTNQDLKQALNQGRVGGGAPVVNINNQITIEGNSNAADVENAIALSTEKMRADLSEDFATGGELTQQLKAAM